MTTDEKRILEDLESRVRELEKRATKGDHTDELFRIEIAQLRQDFNTGVAHLHDKYDAHEQRNRELLQAHELRDREFLVSNNRDNRRLIWAMILILAALAGVQKMPEILQFIP